MHITNLVGVKTKFEYGWPDGSTETYDYCVEYKAIGEDGEHSARIGFGKRTAYVRERIRVVVWIDEHPHAEFLSADDFDKSGDILSEIKVAGDRGERICRYPEEAIPERYTMFNVVGLPNRVNAPGVHSAWAVVANVADHKVMVSLAGLRRQERKR